MNINEVYSGSYLKADDLQGRRVTVKINHVSIKEFEGDKGMDRKIVLGFEGKDKCLVCNKTNSAIVAENVGSPDTDDWIGAEITLEPRRVEFQGKLVPAIRVVLKEQAVAAAPAPAPRPARPLAPLPDPDAPRDPPEPDDVPF